MFPVPRIVLKNLRHEAMKSAGSIPTYHSIMAMVFASISFTELLRVSANQDYGPGRWPLHSAVLSKLASIEESPKAIYDIRRSQKLTCLRPKSLASLGRMESAARTILPSSKSRVPQDEKEFGCYRSDKQTPAGDIDEFAAN